MASSLQGCLCLWSLVLLLLLLVNSGFISAELREKPENDKRKGALLQMEDEEEKPVVIKKKVGSAKNQTKPISKKLFTSDSSTKNQTKILKLYDSAKINKTKVAKTDPDAILKPELKKLNSTSNSTAKGASLFSIKSSDQPKVFAANNKTSKPSTNKETKVHLETSIIHPKSNKTQPKKPQTKPDEDDGDLVTEFRDLPAKFQETIVPDLQRISRTSKSYISKYNKEFARGFKPYVGNKYASTIASTVSFAFIIIPLILVSLVFNRIKAHFSLQKILIFIQIYLAIYFSILCLSSLLTGLEPLRFLYSSSQSTYVCVQVLQTLSYVLYLLLLLMYLILVFSTETGLVTRLLSLGYTFVGFSVGLHYYMTVFHRAILRQLPKTSWKVHGLYAACFIAVCLLGRFDRAKKAYIEGGDEGKNN